ncbi:hypothetical protein [Nocardia farcinica]|uniref:hypothetical protein n=1 Tax=Nocardia farcinica TaxID=37329 RepID=UPI002455765B|nr:hypothetical protein [Nocardia farcinica]
MTIADMIDSDGKLRDAFRALPTTPARPAAKPPTIDCTRDVIDALGDGTEALAYMNDELKVIVSAARYAELLEQARWGRT